MGWQEKIRELAWEASQDKLREERRKEILHIESEQAVVEKLEREKNSIIEPDFEFKGVVERSGTKQSEVDKKPETEFDKRLEVLKMWMEVNNFKEGVNLPKHYTVKKVYCELAKMGGGLFNSVEFSSFERHFWRKQKICKLTRGNKSTIL